MFPLGAFLLSSQLIAVADGIPSVDLKKTCHLVAGVQTTPTQNEIDRCISDEQSARDQVTKEWAQFSAADRSQCVQMAMKGYLPSYIELITCLEMSKYAKTLPKETAPRSKEQR